MKILFVENKYKTLLYKELVKRLELQDHESYFLNQNKVFSTGEKDYYVDSKYDPEIESPELEALFAKCLEIVSKSDRNLNYFGGNNEHYKGYFYNIYNVITELKPDVVFGESTLFHELITIFICKNKGILYLHPCSCRIPSKRFSFYIGDTLNPYLGSQEVPNDEFCNDIIESFGYRKKTLDYMVVPNKIHSLYRKGRLLKNWITGLVSWIIGERFNTPSLTKKLSLQRMLKKSIKTWDKGAQCQLQGNKKKILYPLHMQPECNVDVWSAKYRHQTKTISQLAEIIPDNWELIVKPNPKSKYEMNLELIEVCSTYENITLINHAVKMKDISADVDLFFTASGTIAYECALTNKPCISLALPFFNENYDVRHLKSIVWADLFSKFNQQLESSKSSAKDLIHYLNKTSYNGVISDPISTPDCISDENMNNLSTAFQSILENLQKDAHHD